jgi:hypothetical protein|tara:strand:+ start:507 stop:701 length:195 start_codon:yes stop_codon:yes gene_type:complete
MGKMSDLHLQEQEDGEMEEQNHPSPDEMPTTGVMNDLDTIVGLGKQVAKNKLTYSFRGIFGGQR